MASYWMGSLESIMRFLQRIRQLQLVQRIASFTFRVDSFPHSNYSNAYCRKYRPHRIVCYPFQQNIMESSQYEHSSDCQDYADYRKEGYYPVALGQRFNQKYVAKQKLGWGHFSTVWLVYNQHKHEYGALKIQRSKPSHSESALDELQMLMELRKHESDPQWLKFLTVIQQRHPVKIHAKLARPLLLTDNFAHHGIHGKHYCSVFEIMGPNLLDVIQHYQFKSKRMPLSLVRKITIDTLINLVYLHEYCKIIHTDLKPENIMIKLQANEENTLIESLLAYRVKPMSMKYLKNISTSKKSKKKKNKKKQKQKQKAQNINKTINNQLKDLQAQSSKEKEEFSESVEQSIQSNYVELKPQNSQKVDLHCIHDQEKTNKFQTPEKEQGCDRKQCNNQEKGISKQFIDKKICQQGNQRSNWQAEAKQQTGNQKMNYQPQIKQAIQDSQTKQINSIQSKKEQKCIQVDQLKAHTMQQEPDTKKSSEQSDMRKLKWKNVQIELDSPRLFFKIVDLGNSCFEDHHFTQAIQTRQYRAPQVLLGHPYKSNTDVWSLACVVFELMTNNFLFKPNRIKDIPKDQDHLYKMIEVLGPIPKHMTSGGSETGQLFNKKGKLLHGDPKIQLRLSKLFKDEYNYDEKDAIQAENFLLPMLAYDPCNRVSALECLQHPWLWK